MNELKRGYAIIRIASFVYMLISFISETSDQNVMSPVVKLFNSSNRFFKSSYIDELVSIVELSSGRDRTGTIISKDVEPSLSSEKYTKI